jgi:hypothetical protein
MDKIYQVKGSDYDGSDIFGTFSNKEAADTLCDWLISHAKRKPPYPDKEEEWSKYEIDADSWREELNKMALDSSYPMPRYTVIEVTIRTSITL